MYKPAEKQLDFLVFICKPWNRHLKVRSLSFFYPSWLIGNHVIFVWFYIEITFLSVCFLQLILSEWIRYSLFLLLFYFSYYHDLLFSIYTYTYAEEHVGALTPPLLTYGDTRTRIHVKCRGKIISSFKIRYRK